MRKESKPSRFLDCLTENENFDHKKEIEALAKFACRSNQKASKLVKPLKG
jgi:hypothetical protein